MFLLLLEALGALLLLVFIVWWTMFSGRKNGELKVDPAQDPLPGEPAAAGVVKPAPEVTPDTAPPTRD